MNEDMRGHWLQVALIAQGVTISQVSKQVGSRPDKYYRHLNEQAQLSIESLRELAAAFPTLNLHYVLTGEGSPTRE